MASTQASPDQLQKARNQRSQLRNRIKSIATDVMNGRINSVTAPYNPTKVADPDNAEWRTLVQNQKTLLKRIQAAKDAMDEGHSKQELIFSLRKDFPEVAKKIPEPARKAPAEPPCPAQPPDPSPAKMVSFPTTSASSKHKQPTVYDDDEDDEEYDPGEDVRGQREERAAKRRRVDAASTESKAPAPMMDEADLEMQIEEIQMKANLQILQLKRKFAADKKKQQVKIKMEM